MNSQILEQIGLARLDVGYVLIGLVAVVIILLIMMIVILTKFSDLQKRYRKFLQGSDAQSLEQQIMEMIQDNKVVLELADNNRKDIVKLSKSQRFCFQKLGVNKYDAFREMGGKLSFSVALLDDNSDGFIINSVHSTDGCYSYVKEIKKGVSAIPLGEEEVIALEKAKNVIV